MHTIEYCGMSSHMCVSGCMPLWYALPHRLYARMATHQISCRRCAFAWSVYDLSTLDCTWHSRQLDQAFDLCMQSQEGYPLVKGDGSQTTTVHTFGKAWDLVGDGYDSVMYGPVQ